MFSHARTLLLGLICVFSMACAGDTPEPAGTSDMGFPTTDVAMTSPPTEEDAGLSLDGVGPDTAVVDTQLPLDKGDTSLPETGLGDSVEEDSQAVDTAPPVDTAPANDTAEPCGQGPGDACDASGQWKLNVTGAPMPGEGCGDDGKPAQESTVQEFIVKKQGNGYTVTMLDADDTPPVVTIGASGAAGQCQVSFVVTVAVAVPGAGDIEGGVAQLLYKHQLSEADGVLTGSGQVTTSFVTDSGKVLVSCTEPTALTGAFIWAGAGNP